MASQTSIIAAASLLIEENGPPPLALCVIHTMRDREFRKLLSTLVELNPVHWPKIREFAEACKARTELGMLANT